LHLNQGLITEGRENIDPEAQPFARKTKEMERQGLKEGATLVEVVCYSFYQYVHQVY
jgi:malate dehydrogenase (decarboxylating)